MLSPPVMIPYFLSSLWVKPGSQDDARLVFAYKIYLIEQTRTLLLIFSCLDVLVAM